MRSINNNKGLMFTLAAAMFVLVILSMVVVHVSQNREHGEALTQVVRCDELNIFLEDITKDMERAAAISSKRAATSAIAAISANGQPIGDAIPYLNELVLNGTVSGTPVEFMENQTLSQWAGKMAPLGPQRNFTMNLDSNLIQVDHAPFDSFNYVVRIKLTGLQVTDDLGYCSFSGNLPRNQNWSNSKVSIIGLEDPLYILGSGGYVSRIITEDTNYSIAEHGTESSTIFDIETKAYHENNTDSPSFFERLEGNFDDPTRHAYYSGLAENVWIEEEVEIPRNGIAFGPESFVDVNELEMFIPSGLQASIIKENQTVVDHLYFGPANPGSSMWNVTNSGYPWFRIDSEHADFYNIPGSELY